MGFRRHQLLLCATLMASAAAVQAADAGSCAPRKGHENVEPPVFAPVDQLISHTEEVVIERPLPLVFSRLAEMKLEQKVYPGANLPRITGAYSFPFKVTGPNVTADYPPNMVLACFSDGSTVLEQPIRVTHTDTDYHQYYGVWNYTGEDFRYVDYGVANIYYRQTPKGHTVVSWTYSFKPDTETYPELAGPSGEAKFRQEFLEGPFAELLRGSIAIWKIRAESQ